jgi:DNA modification methylase
LIEVNKIYNESNLDTMSRMPDAVIDLVVTSPPYDGLRDYKGFSFDFPAVANELYRVIKPGGVVVWVVGDQTSNGSESGTSFRQALYFKDIGFNLHDTMIYEKNTALPNGVRYFQVFEYMFVFSKGRPKTINLIEDRKNRFREKWGSGRVVREKDGTLSKRGGNYVGREYGRRNNIWRYNTGYRFGTKDTIAFEHPATFPDLLASDHIRSWSNEGDLVYDCFGGSGTTAKMSHILKRNWILSEISKEYCDIAEKRIAPYLAQTILF